MMFSLLLGLAVQNPTVEVVGEKPAKERKVCKKIEGTGSRLNTVRDCRTAAQWRSAQRAELDARDLNAINNTEGMNAGQNSNP